jgi:hypothetical protein
LLAQVLAIGVVGLLVALVVQNQVVEGARGGVGSSAKQVKLAIKADKRSRRALKLARQAKRIARRNRG